MCLNLCSRILTPKPRKFSRSVGSSHTDEVKPDRFRENAPLRYNTEKIACSQCYSKGTAAMFSNEKIWTPATMQGGVTMKIKEMMENIKMVDPRSLNFVDQARKSFSADHVADIMRKMEARTEQGLTAFDPKKFVEARLTKSGQLIVLHGEHRSRAAVEMGLSEIPVFIVEEDHELTDLEIAQIHLEQCSDNMGRPMEIMEQVEAAENALAEGIPIETVASSLGKTVQSIQKDRILAVADKKIKDELSNGAISKQVAVHLTEICENRKAAGKRPANVSKLLQKVRLVKGAAAMIKAADLYMIEVVKSEMARSGNLFAKDTTETEKTENRKDKGFIAIHNGKDFTVKNAESYFKQLMNAAVKYHESPLGNGSAPRIMDVDGKTAFEVRTLSQTLIKISKKLEDVALTYETKAAVANA